MTTRNWSIRSKITILLLIPLLALVVLWGFATSLTVPPAVSVLNFRTTTQSIGLPAEVLITELQRERRISLVYLGGRAAVLPALDEQRARTDEAAAAFRRTAGADAAQDAAGGLGRQRIRELFDALDQLRSGRTRIDGRDVDRTGALKLYNGIVDAAFRMFPPLSEIGDSDLAREYRAVTELAQARELLAREDALVSGAIVGGWFNPGETAQVVQLIGMQRYVYVSATAELTRPARADFRRLAGDPPFVALRALEDLLVAKARDGRAVPVEAAQWQHAFEAVIAAVRDFEVAQSKSVAERAKPVAMATGVRLGLAGVLGLLAVIASLIISLRIGRSLVNRLAGLRREALDLAENRLPAIVGRLRRGEEIDIPAEAPPLEYGADEIGQVGRAFTEVQRTAVRSAVDEADVRRGLSEVFLNIARRSQALVHRQLVLFDKMERRATKPEDLECLFQVDHLATRMRRHAEDLVILAGAAPGRGWRNPVPVIDIARGAISEVEDYARVNVSPMGDAALIGPVVGDTIHLLAELIENATSFSPPETRVQVSGQEVPNGYAIEVEDRGLGMPPEAIAEANERLAAPPDFDPHNSARLGLFVVAKLAARQGLSVQLRPSPYGGVTAVVLIPESLVVSVEPEPQPVGAAAVRALPAKPPDRPVGVGPLNRRPRTGGRLTLAPRPELVPVGEPDPEPSVDADTEPAPDTKSAPGTESAPDTKSAPGTESAPTTEAASDRQPVEISEDGLPRRVRQASLAPQLREPSEPSEPAADEPVDTSGRRAPEQVRSRMSALQEGTRRGRIDGAEAAETGQWEIVPVPDEAADHSLRQSQLAQAQEDPPSAQAVAPPTRRTDPEEDA